MRFQHPFSPLSEKELFQPWISLIRSGESGSIVNIPKREQLYRLNHFLAIRKNFKKEYPGITKTKFNVLDPAQTLIEDKEEVDNYIYGLKNINESVLIVLDADIFLLDRPHILAYVDTLQHTHKFRSIIYFFHRNITSSDCFSRLSQLSTVYKNITIHTLRSNDDIFYFIGYLENKLGITVPVNVQKIIRERCGNILWLIKEAVREYAKNKDIKTIFSQEGMSLKLKITWSEFEDKEKEVLEKIATSQFQFSPTEWEVVGYFIKTGLVTYQKDHYTINSPLLTEYIKEIVSKKTKISLSQDKRLLINELTVDSLFSRRERVLLRAFLEKRGEVLSRDVLGTIIWGTANSEGQYSDWALDQMIRRLRKKIRKIGITENLIQTKRNKGFIFISNYGTH